MTAGGTVTVQATGFAPGETVTVSMTGVEAPLATVSAGPGGRVEAVVRIPPGAALGPARLELVGNRSTATADLALEVAAADEPVPEDADSRPALLAGIALLTTAGALGAVARRRSRGHPAP
ncbi:hypothetical protein [Modestobacter roseus]|uniref:Uncharacterized protein n=1 Tax=Modestobacter roseus TaxID=1181884 RepID=A0A562IWR8_9ACTN|nr:hypothetical protein [Modestobacter roseus]MQA34043.1 hypothetical protein [Modestobacter roseus]TWH75407.1 hypothetical protein JD78_03965 [Modestobacter roseus]